MSDIVLTLSALLMLPHELSVLHMHARIPWCSVGMDPDHALARLILVDIAEGKSSRIMKDSIKPWWVRGLAMANGSPKEISWRDMFPICARLIKQYEKAVPDASRHKGAFAMIPEWLDIISEYLIENILVEHNGVSLYKFWTEYSDVQRIRIQTAPKSKCKAPQYKLKMNKMLHVRAHAVQKFLEATAARSAQVSKSSSDCPRVIEHDKLGKIDPHLRSWCFNPVRTGGRRRTTNLKDFVYDLLDQKSWKHNIKWVTAERDLRKYKIKHGDYKGVEILAYDPLFWVMVWGGGSILDDPGRWLQKFYTRARKQGSTTHMKTALIPRHYAATFYTKYWNKPNSKLGRAADWVERACTACSQKTLNEANYRLLHFVRDNTLDREEWTWIDLYAGEQKISVAGGIFSGWSLHSLRKLCGKRAMKKWIDSGLSDGGKMLLLQRMRWTSIDMSAIYTMQSTVDSAMTCRDMENRSSLNQALMALAFANQDQEVSFDGKMLPVCDKGAMAQLVSQIAGICAA